MSPSKSGKSLALIGAWLQLGMVFGGVVAVREMSRAFETLSQSQIGDPVQLSSAIGGVLEATAIGVAVALVGFLLLLVALIQKRYRATWLFWFLTIYGTLLVLGFPYTTPFGFFLLIYCGVRRDEFFPQRAPAARP